MTAKEYLKQVERAAKAIEIKKEQREEIHRLIMSPRGVSYDKPEIDKKAADNNGLLKNIIRLNQAANEVELAISNYIFTKGKIINEILMMDKQIYIDVLAKVYIDIKPLEQVAKEMNYEYEYIRHVHLRALKAFEEKYLKN